MTFSNFKDFAQAILTLWMENAAYALFFSCFSILLAYIYTLIWQPYNPAMPHSPLPRTQPTLIHLLNLDVFLRQLRYVDISFRP